MAVMCHGLIYAQLLVGFILIPLCLRDYFDSIVGYIKMYAGVGILWWSVGISEYFLSNQHYQINFEGFVDVFFIYFIILISYPLKCWNYYKLICRLLVRVWDCMQDSFCMIEPLHTYMPTLS